MKNLMLCGIYVHNNKLIASQFVHAQALAIKKQGHDVAVLSLDMRSIRQKRKWGVYLQNIDDVPVTVASFPCGPIPYLLDFISKHMCKLGFKTVLENFGKPDIIHAHFQYANSISKIAQKEEIPILTTEHATWVLNQNRTPKKEKLARRAYIASNKVICVSKDLCKSIKSFYDKDVEIVPNIVSSHFINKNLEKYEDFTFISIGNFVRHKNHHLTIQAFKKFNDLYPNSKLLIAGKGVLEQEYIDLIKELKLTSNVEILGYVQNTKLVEYYNKSHCFCLPSEYETFGVVYIEALACGLPVIATENSKYNQIIDESNGLSLSEYTVDSIFKAMCYIYDNYDNYKAKKISEDCLAKYGEDIVARQIIGKYEEILNEKFSN
ncbi:MAG: glycosyltransferase [Clostridia bacterium]